MVIRFPASAIFLCAAAHFAHAQSTGSYVNFESPQVSPIRLSPDGTRLFAANTADNRLSVFDVTNPANPVLLSEIRVGLEPVSVNPRTNDEVWVVNRVSDSISIVSVSQGIVIDTIQAKDEPADVVFAGAPPRAFVSIERSNQVRVFDIITHAQIASIPLQAHGPRSLTTSADGSKVYVAFATSGNRTTSIPKNLAPPQDPPTNPNLPPPPPVARIVDATDPAWTPVIPYTVLDHDVAEINANTASLSRFFDRTGTVNFGIAVNPVNGDLYITNTDARNLIRFETNLKGHFVDNRVTRVTTGASPVVTPFDLNAGLDYTILPNAPALATTLAQPAGIVFEPSGAAMWIAAFGSDKVARVSGAGAVLARVDVGPNSGGTVNSKQMRGPRGLALDPSAGKLYVQNRVSNTISVVDTSLNVQIQEIPVGSYDPTPGVIRDGRGFLYDAKLSGNGHASCAGCHIDAETDMIAWDLGNPAGSVVTVTDPQLGTQFQMHPMKGPMLTQHLHSMKNIGPYHWRGDKTTLNDFNIAFANLMGGAQIAAGDMQQFSDFMETIQFQPNPNQRLDRTLPTSLPGVPGNPAQGFLTYNAPPPAGCVACHKPPTNYTPHIAPDPIPPQGIVAKSVPFRDYYRRTGFNAAPGAQNIQGFGFNHDGTAGPFPNINLSAFFMCYDAGIAPIVGFSRTIAASNAASAPVVGDINLMMSQVAAGNCDLVAHGLVDGSARGFVFNTSGAQFISDTAGVGPFTFSQLQTKALSGNAILTFMAVPVGSGNRIGIDRDLDGTPDGDEGTIQYISHFGSSSGACAPQIMGANSPPFVGNSIFTLTCTNAPPNALGICIAGDAADVAGTPFLGITLFVSTLSNDFIIMDMYSEGSGFGVAPVAIPNNNNLAGRVYCAQAIWLSVCGPQGISSSDAISILLFEQ
ncbi:MAG: YncE family protein [Planctomycetes bacterium]|nr:YncE family protein [Planctomycetota bacterium]